MATKTIDQYDLSSQLNDNDLFLIAKYNSSSNSYTAYNKVKYSTIKAAMTEIAQANAGSGSGGGTPSTGGISDYNEYTQTLTASNEDLLLLAKYDSASDSYTDYKTVKVSAIRGADNLSEEYVVLKDDKGIAYRVYLAPNGNGIKKVKEELFNATPPTVAQSSNYHGLLVNMIYGAGTYVDKMPVSHNFIELYNNTKNELNLNGLYLWYKDTTTYTSWVQLPLKGSVPAYSSFLIVGARCANTYDTQCRCQITNYDMVFNDTNGNPMKFSDNGFSVYISTDSNTPASSPEAYLKDGMGNFTTNKTDGYIDLFGCGGETAAPPACNIYYRQGMNRKKGARRVDFYNIYRIADFSTYIIKDWCGNDWLDSELVDFSNCHPGKFPRSTFDGQWDMFSNYEDMFDENGINYFNFGLGENAETTRTFVFQTKASREKGYVWYRKQGEAAWKKFECSITKWHHPHIDVNINKATIKNLETGATYEYMVGTESIQSSVHTFKTWHKDLNAGDSIRILWTSDPQSWNITENYAYYNVCKKILTEWEVTPEGEPNFDYWHSTGDETQNSIRQNPELYGTNIARHDARWTIPFMVNIGNNDLYLKKYGQLFQINFNNEQSNPNTAWNGFFHYQIGDVLFVAVSSNEDRDYVSGDPDGAFADDETLGGFATWDEFLQAEADALDTLLHSYCSSGTPPRWIIASTHQMPVTCTRQQKMQKFIPVLEKYNVDLMIGGHQHCFSASKPLHTGYNGTDPYNYYYDANQGGLQGELKDESGINKIGNKANGTYYISLNSSGWKCSGKQSILTKVEQYPSTAVAGLETGGTNFDYYSDSFLPWWHDNGNYSKNGELGASNVKLPNYAIIEINKDKIHVIVYQLNGMKSTEQINGTNFTYAKEYDDEIKAAMTRTKLYEIEILATDRSPRPTGA